MSCCDPNGLLQISDALNVMRNRAHSPVRTINEMLARALGSILAEDIVSPINVPQANNSAVDGFAVNAEHCNQSTQFTVIGTVLAGQLFKETLAPKQCVRIMTGAAIPQGTTCVVMQEQANCVDNHVTFDDNLALNSHVRFAGEDISAGDTVLATGTKIGPAELGVLASMGLAYVAVFSKVTVAIFSTGDELQPVGLSLKPGKIYESNRAVCASKLKKMGCEIIDLGIIKDCPKAITQAFDKAAEQADVIITSGGVSVGEADYVKDVLVEQGQIDFWKIAIKPGKPFAFGRYKEAIFFGLPGNPVATYVTFDILVNPILRQMSGMTRKESIYLDAMSVNSIKKRAGRVDYQRGNVSYQDGKLAVTTPDAQGSHIMTSLTQANSYIVLDNDTTDVNAGDTVKVVLFDTI